MSKTAPAHYPVDLFVIADQLGMSTRLFSAFKYIARAGKKPGESVSDDLRKAIKCLEMEIARLEPAQEAGKWQMSVVGVVRVDLNEMNDFKNSLKRSADNMDGQHGPALTPEQRFTPSDMAEYHNPDHPANAVKCPKASEPADPEWDALTANMTTPA